MYKIKRAIVVRLSSGDDHVEQVEIDQFNTIEEALRERGEEVLRIINDHLIRMKLAQLRPMVLQEARRLTE